MLNYLKINNIALIDELELTFGGGLNILTGETGAGKSILFDSINFVLGQRAGKELIRAGCSFAQVEALICVADTARGAETAAALFELGVELGDDRSLMLHRHFTDAGKNVCKVNGRVVTVAMLKEISALLIDIHGQHEHQSLLNSNRHIGLLDKLCGGELADVLAELDGCLKQRREVMKEIKSVSGGDVRNVDVYKEQIKEIEKAKLKPDEEELLNERKQRAKNAEKFTAAITAAARLLLGEDDGGAVNRLASAVPYLGAAAEIDAKLQPVLERISELSEQLADVCADAARYFADAGTGESLDEIEERLDLIYRLKKKYAHGASSTIGDVLLVLEQANEKVEFIEKSGELLAALNERRKIAERDIAVACAKASKIRKSTAASVSARITEILHTLGMKDAVLDISAERKNEVTALGFDRVEFMISANKGEPPKPLSKIASGGEMSRVMLALKTVLAGHDTIETFIFDEIDSGVSGRTAHMVAEKLAAISKQHQILCITHLPQIAAFARSHYLITKSSDGEKTRTYVQMLDHRRSVEELARLIGGAIITETTLKAAEEMKQMKEDE